MKLLRCATRKFTSSTLRRVRDQDSMRSEPRKDAVGNVIDVTNPIHGDEHSALSVHLYEGRGFAKEYILAMPDGILRVIYSTLLQRTLAKPCHHDLDISDEPNNGVKPLIFLRQNLIEKVHLRERAGVTIEKETCRRVWLLEARPNELIGEGVRNVVACIHNALDLDA